MTRLRTTCGSAPQILQKLRSRVGARHQQPIPGPSASYIKEIALGVVDLFNVSIVRDRLDAVLQWDHLVVAGHHNRCAELQPFCQVHGADTGLPVGCLHMLVQNVERNTSSGNGSNRPRYLGIRANEDT